MLVIAVLLGLATGVLFGYTSKKTDKQDRSGKDPTAPVVLAEISGLVGVYTLGACAFILGYIGWWGGTEPPEPFATPVWSSCSAAGWPASEHFAPGRAEPGRPGTVVI